MEEVSTISKPTNSNSVAIAGEFAVLSQLALNGFDASFTLGHTKGVDILVSNPLTGKMYRLEVKTSYKNKPTVSKLFGHTLNWIMGSKHEGVVDDNLYFCFVNIEQVNNSLRYFIVPNKIVSSYVKEQHQFWLDRDNKIHPQTKTTMRAFRIGLGVQQSNYTIRTTLAKEYEDRWELLA